MSPHPRRPGVAPAGPDAPWLVEFSDPTALQWSLASVGVGSLHGPAVVSLAADPDWSQELLRAIPFGSRSTICTVTRWSRDVQAVG